MATRIRTKNVPLSAVTAALRKERAGCTDVYVPLQRVKVDIRDPNAEVVKRYQVQLAGEDITAPIAFTDTSLRQFGRTVGVPPHIIDRLPPALGLKVLRCMLEVTHEKRPQSFLLRLKARQHGVTLRALLPGSYVRFDDAQVVQAVGTHLGAEKVKVIGLAITDDILTVRVIAPEEHNLGPSRQRDAGFAGLDIRSSETGRYALEVRELFWRLLCDNGVTRLVHAGATEIRQNGSMDRARFGEALAETLQASLVSGGRLARRLTDTRTDYVPHPDAEVDRIFRTYNLGSPRGRIARWVREELQGDVGLLGLRRFDLVQAFTSVAQRLDYDWRPRVEDAMGNYVWGDLG